MDFYSASELRDLLFHVKEHQFSLPQIERILMQLGLVFIGFEFSDKTAKKNFKKFEPKQSSINNLHKWHDYELLNPNIFAGMYQFWCQKP
jgi:hypothetical protein